jgi:integrase
VIGNLSFPRRTKKLQYRVESNSLVLGDKEWTPHDLRRTGATMMQNLLGLENSLLITDLCLHHNVVTGSAKHYLFDDYADDMKVAWTKLGNRIESILSSNNVVNFEKLKA